MLAPMLHVLPLATIVRERTLPIAGKVSAHMNQRVSPTDVIAEANFAREHVLLDVARTFGITAKAADKLIKVNTGDRLTQGALVADAGGIIPRSIRAPRSGRVMVAGGGQVLMEVGDARIELRAGLSGIVLQVLPDRGVVIRTTGALIQGVWGNGRIDHGSMVKRLEKPDDVLTADKIDASLLRGMVILGGHVRDADTLRAAAEAQVRGLILSSMYSSLLATAYQMKYPIMLTEGFGALPMNSAAYKLLTTNNEREVTVNAEHFDRYNGNRPEVIIPLPVTNEPAEPLEYETFAVGQTVRLRRPPNASMLGAISAMRPNAELQSGLRAPAADVKLENGESVTVPLVNLEVVG